MKVFVEGNDTSVEHLFRKKGFSVTSAAAEADICVFTGGEDVSPYLYGETELACSVTNEARDKECIELFGLFKDKVKIGICRGAQFLNVMNGGKMYQDVNNHRGSHVIYTPKGEHLGEVTSTHHQMMVPAATGIVMAVAERTTKRTRAGGTVVASFDDDTEVVKYESTQSLCFQPHPEYNHVNTEKLFWQGLGLMQNKELKSFLGVK